MKISVLAKVKSKLEGVEKQPDGTFVVRVHVPPVEGQANERISELLADYFGVSKIAVSLVSGSKGKHKIFEIKT